MLTATHVFWQTEPRNCRRWRVQDGRVVEETCDFRK